MKKIAIVLCFSLLLSLFGATTFAIDNESAEVNTLNTRNVSVKLYYDDAYTLEFSNPQTNAFSDFS